MSGITHKWSGTVLTVTSDSGTSSADLKGAKGDDGARGGQGVGVVDYTILNNYVKKDELIELLTNDYLQRKVKYIESTNIINIQTRFESFGGAGTDRQSIYLFGSDNSTPIHGLIIINDAGACSWSGTGEVVVSALNDGIIEVRLPVNAYDAFTIISGQSASIL